MKKCILLVLAVILLLSAILPGYMALADDAQVLSSFPAQLYMDAATRSDLQKRVNERVGDSYKIEIATRKSQLKYDDTKEKVYVLYGMSYYYPDDSRDGLAPVSLVMTYSYYVPDYFHIVMGVISLVLFCGSASLIYLALKKRKVQPVQTDAE